MLVAYPTTVNGEMNTDRVKVLIGYIPVLTGLVSVFSFFGAWVVALDSRMDTIENRLFRLNSVVVSAQQNREGSYCNIDLNKFLEENGNGQ